MIYKYRYWFGLLIVSALCVCLYSIIWPLYLESHELLINIDRLKTSLNITKPIVNNQLEDCDEICRLQLVRELLAHVNLEVKKWQMTPTAQGESQLLLTLTGSAQSFENFFSEWASLKYFSIQHLFLEKKSNHQIFGEINIIDQNKSRVEKVTHQLKLFCDDKLSHETIFSHSIEDLSLIGTLEIEGETYKAVAWPSDQLFFLKKGDYCCSEHMKVSELLSQAIIFVGRGKKIEKRHV